MKPKGDQPRKIVVCHPDHVIDVQQAVTKLRYGDVLVKPNRHVEPGKMYIIDGDAMDPRRTVRRRRPWLTSG